MWAAYAHGLRTPSRKRFAMPSLGTQTADALQNLGPPPSANGHAPGLAFPERTPLKVPVGSGMPHGWPLLWREAELAHLMEAIAGGRPGIVLAGAVGGGEDPSRPRRPGPGRSCRIHSPGGRRHA